MSTYIGQLKEGMGRWKGVVKPASPHLPPQCAPNSEQFLSEYILKYPWEARHKVRPRGFDVCARAQLRSYFDTALCQCHDRKLCMVHSGEGPCA
jgi:hypothetical protein